jgi:hypothetical protein
MEIFPNPVIHSTKLKLIVLYPINVSIELVNIIGEKFTLIPQKFYLPGIYIIELNNKELTQGFYYCWLMSDMGNALVQLLIM